MATLETIANKNSECGGASANTGTLGCQIGFGTPLSPVRLKKGTVIPKNTDFTIAYINGLIADRTLTPFMNATAFEDLSTEDTYSTSTAGVKRLNLKGLVEYKFTYEEGHEFYRELSKAESFKSSDWIFFDESGNLMLAIDSNGDFKGFEAGQVTPEMTKRKVQGGDPESKSIMIQLLNRKQSDQDYAVILAEQLGFDAQEDIRGVNSASAVFDAIPSAGTTFDARIVLDSDRNTNVGGLTSAAEFLYTVNGASVTISSIAESNGVYTFTVPAISASEVITLELNGVVNLVEVLYAKGETAKATVIS